MDRAMRIGEPVVLQIEVDEIPARRWQLKVVHRQYLHAKVVPEKP
jgi:hypothetical protein